MLTIGNDVFLQLAGESRRMLHPSKIVEVIENEFTVELEENLFSINGDGDGLSQDADQEIMIYYNLHRNFFKQVARIEEVLEIADDQDGEQEVLDGENACEHEDKPSKVLFRFELLGEPVSAESRQCYRVSTVLSDLSASFGQCNECQLVDISPTGFAVISPEEYPVNKVITATPRFEDLAPTGPVCIQSVRALNDGRFRYGVHCVENGFREEVQKLSMELQRRQLRRLACQT